jgi:hypothetical protein
MAFIGQGSNTKFDSARVSQFLGKWHDGQMSSALRRPLPAKDAGKQGCTVYDIQPEMSSTKAVPVLLELAKIIGFEPSKKVIKIGGYRSKEEFVQDMCKRTKEAFEEHYGQHSQVISKAEKEVIKHAQI